jgi:hypothetical protein
MHDPRSKGNARRVLDGDERHVLEATMSVVSRLNDLIDSSHRIDFGEVRQDWEIRAAKFWGAVQSDNLENEL